MADYPRLDVPSERGESCVSLILDGPKAGQLAIWCDDDYYNDRTKMTRAEAVTFVRQLVLCWRLNPEELCWKERPPSAG